MSAGSDAINAPAVEISPRIPAGLGLGELWRYRELLYFLVWRDVKVRYKQTALGIAWAVLQPAGLMIVFSVFLGRLARVPSDGVPYPLFVLCGLLPWQMFSGALNGASASIVTNERLVSKVYFPRVIIPAAAVADAVVDFVVSLFLLLAVMPYFGVVPAFTILAVPMFVALGIAAAFAAGLWLSALNVRYRDVRYALGFLIQFWMFLTPVVYSSSLVPERWRWVYGLNPMVAVIDGFRWAVLRTPAPSGAVMTASIAAVVVTGATGMRYFRRVEDNFADII